jgi:hypothetical protein
MRIQPLAVTLEATEWQFLVTTLQGTSAMLKALAVLKDTLPGFQLPITSDMIINIVGLTERIEDQVKISRQH